MKTLPKNINELLDAGFYPIDTSSLPMVYKNPITQKELYVYSVNAGNDVKITDRLLSSEEIKD